MATTESASRLVSQAEYARMRGVTRQAIGDLVKRKIIPLFDGKVDVSIADLKASELLDPAKSKSLNHVATVVSDSFQQPNTTAAPPSDVREYQSSRATRERYAALQAEQDYKVSQGLLLNRESVERALTEAGRTLRDTLLGLPAKIAGSLLGQSQAEIEQLLTAELRRALENFASTTKTSTGIRSEH